MQKLRISNYLDDQRRHRAAMFQTHSYTSRNLSFHRRKVCITRRSSVEQRTSSPTIPMLSSWHSHSPAQTHHQQLFLQHGGLEVADLWLSYGNGTGCSLADNHELHRQTEPGCCRNTRPLEKHQSNQTAEQQRCYFTSRKYRSIFSHRPICCVFNYHHSVLSIRTD